MGDRAFPAPCTCTIHACAISPKGAHRPTPSTDAALGPTAYFKGIYYGGHSGH